MQAQIKLDEGKIIYDVFITSNQSTAQGQLIITLKNGIMKRETKMNTGFANTIIYNSKTQESWTYNSMNGTNVAKKTTKEELQTQNQKFVQATYTPATETKTIANYNCTPITITYKDGTSNTVYYTKDVIPGVKEYNSMFPEINGLPLQYEVSTNGKNKILLIANTISIAPIDVSEVEGPKDYKILTQ